MGLQQLGRILVFAAVAIAALGLALWVFGKLSPGVRLGTLPGDVRLHGEGWGCFVPITTSILLSLVLTIAFSVLARFLGK